MAGRRGAPSVGPMQALPGTGGPFFKLADKIGWQAKYTPQDFCSAYEVELARNAAVLVVGAVSAAQVEQAAKAFGKVLSVFQPTGESFAIVHFADIDAANKCVAELKAVGEVAVQVQSSRVASEPVLAWRQKVREQAAAAAVVTAH